jgi:Flp pilus assembly protein TadB
MQRTYLAPLVTTGIGRLLIVMSFVLMAVGCLWLRRIVSNRG